MNDVCEAFNIPNFFLKDHYEKRVRKRKIGPKSILTIEEEDNLVAYMMKMVRLVHPLNVNNLNMKVAKICQQRHISIKDGILRRNWLNPLNIDTPI